MGRFDYATGSFLKCNSPSLPSLVCDKIVGPWVQNHVSTVRMAMTMSVDYEIDICACFPLPSSSVSMWAAMADFEFCGDVIFYFLNRIGDCENENCSLCTGKNQDQVQ
jgi:hypothetical protein